MTKLRDKKGFICDMDGVIYHGDRMDTDIIAGIESEIETVMVLSGITKREDLVLFPYQPDHILNRAVDILAEG